MNIKSYFDRGAFGLFAVMMVATLAGISGGYAQAAAQGSMSDQTATPTAATATPTSTATTKPAELTEAQKKELQTRIQKRIADQKVKLTAAQQNRLATKCVSAQGALSSAGQRMDTVKAKRTEVYNNIIAKLTGLTTKLKAQNVDTTALESHIKVLQTKIDTYNTDLAAYKQAVSDMTAMDCSKDPTAFQASLEAARTALAKVRTDAAAVSEYVKNTIKPTLVEIRQKLSSSTQTVEGSEN